jgi:Sec-independent protein translocase protein TatA
VLSLSPTKILVILVLGLLLLGPDKLPQVSRQIGAVWKEITRFRERVESTVRESLPDLPSTTEIAKMARSPVSFLNSLADMPNGPDDLVEDPAAGEVLDETGVEDEPWPADGGANVDLGAIPAEPLGEPRSIFSNPAAHDPSSAAPAQIPADPSLN